VKGRIKYPRLATGRISDGFGFDLNLEIKDRRPALEPCINFISSGGRWFLFIPVGLWKETKKKVDGMLREAGLKPDSIHDIPKHPKQPHRDMVSLCNSCGCMTKTIHDEEIMERCGKCGIEKSGGESPKRKFKSDLLQGLLDIKEGRNPPKPDSWDSIDGQTHTMPGKPYSKKVAGHHNHV
jgi:hypothetical protein